MSWNTDFWNQLIGEQSSIRFEMYFRKRDDLRLPVEVVGGAPRVPVDAHTLGLLDRIDEGALLARLDGDHRNTWSKAPPRCAHRRARPFPCTRPPSPRSCRWGRPSGGR